MAIIGNPIIQTAFVTDQFSGTGSQTAFTMSVAPANTASTLVAVSGVLQDPSTYSVSGTTLTFTGAPPSGTGNISVRYLGVPASSVVSTAYRTITEFTATAGQTTFSPPTYTAGFINVFRNGVRLGSADFTASNGTTVVLGVGASAGDLVTTESYYVSSIVNGLPATGGTLGGQLTINAQTGQQPFIVQLNGTEYLRVNSSGYVGIGNTNPTYPLSVGSSTTRGVVYITGTSSATPVLLLNNTNATNGHQWNIYAGSSAPGNLDFTDLTAGSNRMVLDGSGNLGLGVTPSAWTTGQALQIYQQGNVVWSNSYGDVSFTANGIYNSGWQYANPSSMQAARYDVGNGNGTHSWGVAGSGTSGNTLTWTTAMTLTNSGQLGIGSTSPYTPLHIQGTSSTSFNAAPAISLYDNDPSSNARNWAIGINIASAASGQLGFIASTTKGGNPNGTTVATLDPAGNFKIIAPATSGTTLYGAQFIRTWVNFGNSGNIGASYGVSSVSVVSSYVYNVNFSTAAPHTNYCILQWNEEYGAGWYDTLQTTYATVHSVNFSGTAYQPISMSVATIY